MPWIDTYVNAPTVVTEYASERDRYFRAFIGETVGTERYSRIIETTTTEYRGLTYAAAKAAADIEADKNTQVWVRRANPAGGYTFVKTETTFTDWQEET